MAKAQGKKAVAANKGVAKKVVARVKSAAGAAKKKVAPKKAAPPPKPAAKKAKAKAAPKAQPKKAPAKAKAAAKAVKAATKKVVKAAKTPVKATVKKAVKVAKKVTKAAPVKAAAKKVVAKVVAAKPVAKAAVRAVAKAVVAKPAPKPAAKPAPKAAPAPAPVAAPAAPPKAAAPVVEEKKRGRRARPRVHSSGAPAAAWLSTEKPRPASFIPAPARAEAPSAVAAPPASSDRLIRPDDVDHPAVRTVPVRIDVEQGAGRFYVIANPIETSVRPGEGIEWDFRYLGGADVSVEEVVVEFEKPSPFTQTVFRTRKPGGARPHRQLSNGALPSAVGRRIEYIVRAINPYKTELANTKAWLNVTA
ncbi:MAG TPA: hypothetical protein VGQ76_11770 [Thermoanaerobaculia bacterium]|jgi:hypothetical protein|nr:hypothetical protein [Thermoanaerobaculia bacterium]